MPSLEGLTEHLMTEHVDVLKSVENLHLMIQAMSLNHSEVERFTCARRIHQAIHATEQARGVAPTREV